MGHILLVFIYWAIQGLFIACVLLMVLLLFAVASGYRWRTPKGPKP